MATRPTITSSSSTIQSTRPTALHTPTSTTTTIQVMVIVQGTREIIENLVITRPRVRPKARMGENSTHPTAGLDLHRRG
ncbi:hypothetical protein BGX29_005829 [Mortierella sp. GBA35]|nr:hypothetical protein BGX29_005829 [Mortierella sp. GBA35]KAG0213620.1 hypothetical protein BGX33_002826 [Mortierella sp. NVP41]